MSWQTSSCTWNAHRYWDSSLSRMSFFFFAPPRFLRFNHLSHHHQQFDLRLEISEFIGKQIIWTQVDGSGCRWHLIHCSAEVTQSVIVVSADLSHRGSAETKLSSLFDNVISCLHTEQRCCPSTEKPWVHSQIEVPLNTKLNLKQQLQESCCVATSALWSPSEGERISFQRHQSSHYTGFPCLLRCLHGEGSGDIMYWFAVRRMKWNIYQVAKYYTQMYCMYSI